MTIEDFIKHYENKEARKQNKKSKGEQYGQCACCGLRKKVSEHHYKRGKYRLDKDNKTFWLCWWNCHFDLHNLSEEKFNEKYKKYGKKMSDFLYKKA